MEMMSSTDTAFKLFDKDKHGFITRAEFAKVLFFKFKIIFGAKYDMVMRCN